MAEDTELPVVLEIKNLYVGYYKDLNIIQDINIKVRYNQITTILGANGVGKSTALKAIFGFLKPSNTKISIYIFLTFLVSMTLSGYHVGIEQELYQSIFNCSDDNLSILEEGKLLESLNVINPDCRNVNFAIFGISLATINFVLSFVISSVSYYLYSNAKN